MLEELAKVFISLLVTVVYWILCFCVSLFLLYIQNRFFYTPTYTQFLLSVSFITIIPIYYWTYNKIEEK